MFKRMAFMKAVKVDIDWHPGLSIYASEAFLKTVSEEYGWVGGTDDNGKLLCVLPYSLIRKAVFSLDPLSNSDHSREWGSGRRKGKGIS